MGLLQEFLLRVLLASAQVDTTSLTAAEDSRVFKNHEQMLLSAETQMPLPDPTLPSQSRLPPFPNRSMLKVLRGSRSSGVRIPQYFDAAWPKNEPIILSGGFLGFFHDCYHMTVRRPYQRPPEFDSIQVLVNPEGTESKLSLQRCLAICSSVNAQEEFFKALLCVRIEEDRQEWPPGRWTPLYELMNCISVAYQVMF